MDTIDKDASNKQITETMKAHMKGSSGWMKFVGIFTLIISGLGLIGFLIMLANGAPINFAVILNLAFLGLYLYMGFLIYKTGSGFSNYVLANTSEHLESALDKNKKLWMIAGILIITMIVLIILIAMNPEGFAGMMGGR